MFLPKNMEEILLQLEFSMKRVNLWYFCTSLTIMGKSAQTIQVLKKKYFEVKNAILKKQKVKVEQRLPRTECWKSKFHCKECTENIYYQIIFTLAIRPHGLYIFTPSFSAFHNQEPLILGAIFILRKDVGVDGWSRKQQFSLTF